MAIRASAAICDITPEAPLPLAGFTGSRRTSNGTNSPLCAAAVHIRSGAGGIIVISLDLCTLDPATAADIRSRVSTATGTRQENVFVAVTGCASAPFTEHALYLKNDPSYSPPDAAYMDLVLEMSVKAASEAAVSSRPASVAVVNFDKPGTGAMVVKGDNGRVIAAVIMDDDVPDYLGPDNTLYSSDFVGVMRERLVSRLGKDAVIGYLSAPSADRMLDKRASYGEDEAANAGIAIAESIMAKLKTLKGSDFDPACAVSGKLIDLYSLPRKALPSVADASSILNAAAKTGLDGSNRNEMQRKFARWALIEANRTMSMVMAYKEGKLETALQDYDPAYIQSVKIGSLRIVGVPCAVLQNAARHILDECGKDVWLAQGVNGTLMGSVMTTSGEDMNSKLLSAVFERDIAVKLVSSILKLSAGE